MKTNNKATGASDAPVGEAQNIPHAATLVTLSFRANEVPGKASEVTNLLYFLSQHIIDQAEEIVYSMAQENKAAAGAALSELRDATNLIVELGQSLSQLVCDNAATIYQLTGFTPPGVTMDQPDKRAAAIDAIISK